MKKFISALLAFSLILSCMGAVYSNDSERTYKELFEKDKIIDINIDIDSADLADMRENPKNEEYHTADVTVDGIKVEKAGIRTKGNMTLNSVANSDSERYSYRIKFNKYVKGNKLLGLDELCLNSGYSDPSYMREYLHYEILRELGMNVPETAFCRVYINGDYAGFYLAVEGLDSTFLKDSFGESCKNGNFYKMDEGATLEYKEDENYSYADLKSGNDTDLTSFKEFVRKLNETTTGEKDDIESFLDVDSALKYIASNTVLCNYDSYNGNMHHNYYLYENENGIFTVVPWDFNMSFGGFNGNNSEVGIDTPYISGSLETLPLIGKLLSVSEYKEKYYGYIKQIMDILESFEDRVTELKNIISPYVKNDTTAFYTYEEFDNATKPKAEAESSENTDNLNKGGKNKPFGGDSSIIECVSQRLDNLNKQFEGSASKTTESTQNGRGGPDFGRKPENGGHGQPPQNNGQTPPDSQLQPPDSEWQQPDDQRQPPENDDRRPPDNFNGEFEKNNEPGGNPPNFNEKNSNSVIRVHINGHIISFDKDPYIKNDTTLVGFRSILEALGAEVSWDESTQTVTASKDDTIIKLVIGSSTAYVNNEAVELPQAPEISDNSTMIPIRFISEQLGMKVSWNGETKLITIVSQ